MRRISNTEYHRWRNVYDIMVDRRLNSDDSEFMCGNLLGTGNGFVRLCFIRYNCSNGTDNPGCLIFCNDEYMLSVLRRDCSRNCQWRNAALLLPVVQWRNYWIG